MDFVVLQKISDVSSRSLNKKEIHVLKTTSRIWNYVTIF
jgi:hypothetical protein